MSMERGVENVEDDAPTTHRHDGETVQAVSQQTEIDSKVWNNLGEELVEKIITRLPLKDIVRSQVLSKKWRSRFQSSSFQKEAATHSSRWGPSDFYHPLILTEKGLCGYDRSTQKWKDLCTLPEFPPDSSDEAYSVVGTRWDPKYPSDSSVTAHVVVGSRWPLWGTNSLVVDTLLPSGTSSLVVGTLLFSGRVTENSILHIFVTNIINKTVRRCPPSPIRVDVTWLEYMPSSVHVHPSGHEHYKLFMFSYKGRYPHARTAPDTIIAAVYDSKLNSWTEFEYVLPNEWLTCGEVLFIRGIVYMPYSTYDEGGVRVDVFCTFDVEKGLFGNISFAPPVSLIGGSYVAWRSKLLFLSFCSERYSNSNSDKLAVHIIDLQTLEHTEISRGAPEFFHNWVSTDIVISDSDCIHLILEPYHAYEPFTDIAEGFGLDEDGFPIENRIVLEQSILVTCNVNKGLWSYTYVNSSDSGYERDGRIELCKESAFQPNWGPFVLA